MMHQSFEEIWKYTPEGYLEHEANQETGKPITKDDITDLKITLGMVNTVDELLEVL